MPSLRRTASSPSVRSSPYSSSSSASVATRGHGHRRSSGSETTGRRVLADIEWWRVTDGQCDPSAADRDDQDLVADDAMAIAVASATSPDLGLEQLHTPSPWITSTTMGSSEVLRSEFAALAITPTTPSRRRHSRGSSSSSLASTPEAAELSLDGMRPDLSDMNVSFLDALDAALPPLISTTRDTRSGTPPSLLMRSHTFADCLSLHDEHPSHYADFAVSPLSSSPDFLN